jgi:NADH-quinone oxidoreductase subunit A
VNYFFIFCALVLALSLIFLSIFISYKISPQNFSFQKNLPYECGEHTIGSSWIKINAGFYTFGLIFLLFDIESIFLIPWIMIMKNIGFIGFIEVMIFVLILVLGLIYAWRKGDLEWKI